jgi:pimeloyl-ACP methyl ester carboxylesterase
MKRLAILSLCVLAGCTSLRSYRTAPPFGPVQHFDDGGGHTIDLAFVEIDDHGLYWDDKEIDAALGMIEDAAKPAPGHDGAEVVVFTHGWTDNARTPDDVNTTVTEFRKDLLRRISRHEHERAQKALRLPRRVVGVYVAWRGRSIWQPLAPLSYYDRNAAAERVADTHVTATFRSLIAKTREHPTSRILIIGHSMGGLITERALGPTLVTNALVGKASAEMPDLVVLENQASSATEALGDIWTLRDKPPLVPQMTNAFLPLPVSQRPIFVSVTSATDWATGLALPIGTYLGSLFQRFRSWGGTPVESSGLPGERSVYAHTVGHLSQLYSHTMTYTHVSGGTENDAPEPCDPAMMAAAPVPELCFRVDHDVFAMKPVPHAWNQTHYWVMQAPKTVINGHSDVWNKVWVNCLIGLLETLTD